MRGAFIAFARARFVVLWGWEMNERGRGRCVMMLSWTDAVIELAALGARETLTRSARTSSAFARGTCGMLVATWIARAIVFGPSLDDLLALTPYSVVSKPWTLVTSGYYEMSLAAVATDCCGLLYIGKVLEPVWGARELARFVLGVNVATATMSWLSMCALYVFSGLDEFYLFAKFGGFHGVLAALLLALRQTSPEEPVFDDARFGGADDYASLRALRNKHLIGAYLCFTAAYAFMSGGKHHHIGLYLFDVWGAYSAWVYLRFFQPHGTGPRGDSSADFAFAALFPPAARPVVARVSAPIGAAARALAERRLRAQEARAAGATADAQSSAQTTQSAALAAADAAVRAKVQKSQAPDDDDAKAKRERLAARGRAVIDARAAAPPEPASNV